MSAEGSTFSIDQMQALIGLAQQGCAELAAAQLAAVE